MKKTSIVLALAFAGISVGVAQSASAAILADGNYNIMINVTPTTNGTSMGTIIPGTDGNWNSTFTFGGKKPNTASQGMTDNSTAVVGPITGNHGGGIAGDGYAGKIGIKVTGGTFAITSFSVDTIFGTAGGDFAQYMNTIGGGGTIDQTTGAIVLNPTNRLGAVGGYPDALYDQPWNLSGTSWVPMTTGSATTSYVSGGKTIVSTIKGHGLVANGSNWDAVIVSGGYVQGWGGFNGNPYLETWNVSVQAAPVPVPAAAWLLGSGLLGLVGVARRKSA